MKTFAVDEKSVNGYIVRSSLYPIEVAEPLASITSFSDMILLPRFSARRCLSDSLRQVFPSLTTLKCMQSRVFCRSPLV